MDGQMGRVGYETACGIENGAGEVEAFFDVSADTGLLKSAAHLFGDGHESMAKDAEYNGIDFSL